MSIAYLDPPYSRYFQALAGQLAGARGERPVALLSCPAYRRYAGADACRIWQPGQSRTHHALPAEFARAEWARPDEAFRRAFSHAVEWFMQSFREQAVDLCLIFSDARPFSAAAQVAARSIGVTCVVFERGAYRLRTASLSTRGLNARFDLRSAMRATTVQGLAPEAVPERRNEEPWLKLRFVAFLLHNEWSCRWRPARRAMQHKGYHFFNYMRIALRQLQVAHGGLPDALPPSPVRGVLVPLQLPSDSQFVMYSPFRHNQEFIDFVVPRIRAALPGTPVWVKRHPMDVRAYRMPEGGSFIDGNLVGYLDRACLMVCLNSAAGFEAAAHGKRVLCFADSFYTTQAPSRRTSREAFAEHVAEAAALGDDRAAGEALRTAVLRFYQAPGDVWAYTDDDIDATCRIVGEHVAAARRDAARARDAHPSAAPTDFSGVAADRATA